MHGYWVADVVPLSSDGKPLIRTIDGESIDAELLLNDFVAAHRSYIARDKNAELRYEGRPDMQETRDDPTKKRLRVVLPTGQRETFVETDSGLLIPANRNTTDKLPRSRFPFSADDRGRGPQRCRLRRLASSCGHRGRQHNRHVPVGAHLLNMGRRAAPRANHVADCFARESRVFAVDDREVETGQTEDFYNLGSANFHEWPEQKALLAEFRLGAISLHLRPRSARTLWDKSGRSLFLSTR